MVSAHREDVRSSAGRASAVPALKVFFPAAAAYAAVALPASVLPILGLAPALPGFGTPAGHGHEMLFGFALAVVAGHQLGPMRPHGLATMLAAWLAARIAFLAMPGSALSLTADVAFAALLGARLAPRLFASAKKLRNQALPFVLAALCAAAAAFPAAQRFGVARSPHAVLEVAVVLLGLLMLFMGGRLIAPTLAGHLERRGKRIEVRVQPRIEAGIIACALVAAAASAFAILRAVELVAGTAMVVTGALAAVRLYRWRLWTVPERPDILCVGAGYAWLAIGFLSLGAATIVSSHETAALHAITVGSIGTLSIAVMASTWSRQARRNPAREPIPVLGAILVAAATVARIGAGFAPGDTLPWLAVATACWSAAFTLLLAFFIAVRPRARPVP